MEIKYHVAEHECRRLTDRPSYSGQPWDALLRSATMTAQAYGRAFIMVTRSNGERAGGKVYVTTSSDGPSWTGLPITVLAMIQELPTCAVCGAPFDHGCNIGVCSEACEHKADEGRAENE